ncbi:MAG: ornithine carbamoyltransferase, partial [Gaiellaceae bacterium]
TSMGQEAEREERLKRFAPFQVNAALMAKAPGHCKVLHCLPAHRGEEVAAAVIDGPQSAVWEQSANRMPTEQALLLALTHGFPS